MGVISRKIFPACGNICICCPALRSRSRQPVKRYKNLLADIFPRSPDAPPNERKIVKLCEYAAKNPFRIPKIVKFLEERCCKELRSEHIKFINIIVEAYSKLLCMCKEQMAYFAISILNVVNELLDNPKPQQNAVQIIGCRALTRFIYSQVDGTYTYNIENLVHKVCKLARQSGEEDEKRCLRASSLQCLSAMVWFMAEFSHIFVGFEEIVHVTLDNYESERQNEDDDERGGANHNWVDEVVRCEGRIGAGAGVGTEVSSCTIVRLRPEKKDPSLLTSDEIETPKVWAQICIQRMVELAKETITMRRVLDPMFLYFDTRQCWVPRHGLAVIILSDICYFVEGSGIRQFILTSVIHHLDHKNVSQDPQVKSNIIQTATYLAQQIRSEAVLSDIGFISDLCRHLRKSLQASVLSVGEQELNLNISLQNDIEDCLFETVKGIADARPLFDMMAITLEKLPSIIDVVRATIVSLIILAHVVSSTYVSPLSQQVFPEALLIQLLKLMLHPDIEVRAGAHQLFSAILIPSSNYPRRDVSNFPRRWHSSTSSAFASVTALLKRLQKERSGTRTENHGISVQDDIKEREDAEEWKQARALKNSPNFLKISSIIDKTAGSTSLTGEPSVMKFSEDQVAQLLSAFWIQANLLDNLPSNIEAIAHSYCLMLISLRLKNSDNNLVVRIFQLPLSLRSMALDPSNVMWPPAYQRLILILSTAMLAFAAKIYQIPDIIDSVKPIVECDVDPHVSINDDYQLCIKPQADVRAYGSVTDNQAAASLLCDLQNTIYKSDKIVLDSLANSLSSITELEADELVNLLSEPFTPDDAFMFGPHSVLDLDRIGHSNESLSCDGDFLTNSVGEDDVASESSAVELSRFIPKTPKSPLTSQIISIGQLMESALEVAGQVAGASVSSTPLSYSAMASHCDALGTCTRKKLSSWLTDGSQYTNTCKKLPLLSQDVRSETIKVNNGDGTVPGSMVAMDPWLALRLPPASPFDNFLRAARY
ncbi:protein SEMI-ROLLED LEAF 2 isoform X2 [Diospyros lotus]|uniref:protein SEMI-ROLLED LEAF 2 isoform X2 n=1 Tax=Diospyros lotus TaxID=55363 RepID=UPI00225B7397|nr:protein SEMI-ROLLED LEAF 2 isoform X2 [Diospyros lotus]